MSTALGERRLSALNGRKGPVGVFSPLNDGGVSATKEQEMKAALLIASSVALAGCSTFKGDASQRRVTYACNYGPNLTVTYAQATARIESAEGTVTLKQRPAGSGFWFESVTHSLRGSGDDITYIDRQMAPRLCHAIK